jgi:hypothetical protein
MPANFNVHNGLIDIQFVWPNIPAATAQEIVFGSALYRWRRGEGPRIIIDDEELQKPWEDLTNQEKLDMVYRGARQLIIAEARASLINTDTGVARDAANQYADDNYDLLE